MATAIVALKHMNRQRQKVDNGKPLKDLLQNIVSWTKHLDLNRTLIWKYLN